MKIRRLKSAVVEGNFDWTFVRIETDDGICGLGECFFAPGLTSILRSLEPLLIGEDPRDIHRLFRKLQLAVSGAGSIAGIIYNAISGIEAALWDVLGQSLEVPIYRLLGGKFRDRVRVYADCHGGEALESLDEVLRSRPVSWEPKDPNYTVRDYFGEASDEAPSSPNDYRRRALKKRAAGFTALKFDLDVPGTHGVDVYNRVLSNRAIDYMVASIGAVYQAVGADIDIAVDCHWRYNASDVVKVARELEPFRLLWLEDPVPPNNTAALKEVSSKVRVPIATGENLFLFDGFQDIIASHALSIVTPDLQKVGGLAVAQTIAQFADAHTMPVAPHNICSPVGTLAAAHFCAAIPNFLALEFHASDVPFWNNLVEGLPKPIIQNGYIRVPDKPGLGITLNEDVARKYARKGEPFFA
ncbi:MAG TPA: mandelate racemase/muconate lactonizing enzyme family protein [Candidatus Eremiobacteraceae bacterium]|nr:mandelate racemase/muconate lactonizing enzyme family protein [Candidatus Eremiobacteraceae bacterium]